MDFPLHFDRENGFSLVEASSCFSFLLPVLNKRVREILMIFPTQAVDDDKRKRHTKCGGELFFREIFLFHFDDEIFT